MSLWSSAKSLVSTAAPYVGAMFGPAGAAAGTAVSGWLGSDTGNAVSDFASSAYDIYSQNKSQDQAYARQLNAGDIAYDRSLKGIQAQNATALEYQNRANEFNSAQADKTNLFNKGQAYDQRSWEQWMSGTAHQREITDLKAAGLNPILSGTGGMGSSTPSGASATGVMAKAEAPPVRSTGDAVGAAFQAMSAMADAMKANSAVTYMNGAQTAQTRAQTSYTSGPQSENTKAQTGVAISQDVLNHTSAALNNSKNNQTLQITKNLKQELLNLQQIHSNLQSSGKLTNAQTINLQQTTQNLKQSFRALKVSGDINEQDQAYWNNLLNNTSGSSAHGTLQLLNSLRSLLK